MYESKIIIGTWNLSGDFGLVKLSEIEKVFHLCYDYGFKTFDTAPVYGNGFMEFCIGKIFNNKDDVKINSKFGNMPFIGKNFDKKSLNISFEHTLKRLNRDYINVLFLHNPRNEINSYDEIIDLMQKLKEEGKILKMGLSMAKGFHYKKIIMDQFDVIQNDINLLNLDSLDINYGLNSNLIARSPLASGLLSGNMTKKTTFDKYDYRFSWLKGERFDSLLKRVDAIINLIGNYSLPDVAKLFLLQNDKIDKVIFGVKSIDHVDNLKDHLNKKLLPDELIIKLIDLYKNDFGLINERHLSY